jgi:cell division septation protein DedD
MGRETELYKDKIEVSLDGRQIFYLFFGGAVIVGMVFVLGVMVGRRVEARGHVERAHVEATVDPLAALDRLEGGSGLSFQGALRGAEPPVSDVEKQINEMAKKPVDPPKAEPKKEELPPAPKKDEPKKDEPKKEAAADEPKPKKEAADEPKPKKEAASDEPKSKKEAADEPKPEKKSKFTLQLSSFKDKDEAQALVDQMKSDGYPASMTKADVDGKQYYRVRMGTYSTVEAANDAKAEFEKSSKKSALVTKL